MNLKETKDKICEKAKTQYLKAKGYAMAIGKWCKDNPQSAMVIGTTVLGTTVGAVKSIRRYQLDHEHDKMVYDPRLQMWHPVRRKLKYDEELFYKYAVRNGDDAREVLKNMNLLK